MVLQWFSDRSELIRLTLLTAGLAVLLQVCYRIVATWLRTSKLKDALKTIPGPPTHWLRGSFPKGSKRENIIQGLMEQINVFKNCHTFWLGPLNANVRLYSPDYLKTIFKSSEPKTKFSYRFLLPWIGNGLLVSEGKTWARARRLLTPAFHFDILKPYIKVFDDSTKIMMNKWRSSLKNSGAKSERLEMFEFVSLMTLDSILKCAFSYDSDVQAQGKANPYIRAVYELSSLAVERVRFFPFHFDWIYYLSPSGRRFREACKTAHDLSSRVIKSRRETLAQGNNKGKQSRYLDFLDILLEAKDADGNGLTDGEIQNEVDTFMFEGHDTTASGISWCLYNLALHPEYQEKCREEINKVMGDREDLTWEDMSELSFVTMCIKESMRVCPPVPFIGREITKPMTLPDSRVIPKGVSAGIMIYGVHHNADVWEDPEKYDPYRFSAQNSSGRSPHAFVPFSAGSRNCIGQNFAMHEMRVCVSQVLRNFRLTVDESIEAVKFPELVLRAKNGLWLEVMPVTSDRQ